MVAKLTLPQFQAYVQYAHEYLEQMTAGGSMLDLLGGHSVAAAAPDTRPSLGQLTTPATGGDLMSQLEAAALRLKRQRFGDINEKKSFTMDEVMAEIKNG